MKELVEVLKKAKVINIEDMLDVYIKQKYGDKIVVVFYLDTLSDEDKGKLIEELSKEIGTGAAVALALEFDDFLVVEYDNEHDAFEDMMKFEDMMYALLYVNGEWIDENT